MLAEIQSQITDISIDILTTKPFKKTHIQKLKNKRDRIAIVALLPCDEIDETDVEYIYGRL